MGRKKYKLDFKLKLKENLFGFIFGFAASGLITLVVWGFAYYGQTNLGLPQRFEFENLEAVIKRDLPHNFTYTNQSIESFRQANLNTVLVVGVNKNFTDFTQDKAADFLALVDKNSREYRISYKFQPSAEGSAEPSPLHVRGVSVNDVSGDGRKDVVIGWSYLGANFSPPYITVLTSHNNLLEWHGLPRLSGYEYPERSKEVVIKDSLGTAHTIKTDSAYGFFVKEGEIAVINRTDDSCSACGDEHVYTINYLNFAWGKLSEPDKQETGIKGWENLESKLVSRGYSVD